MRKRHIKHEYAVWSKTNAQFSVFRSGWSKNKNIWKSTLCEFKFSDENGHLKKSKRAQFLVLSLARNNQARVLHRWWWLFWWWYWRYCIREVCLEKSNHC